MSESVCSDSRLLFSLFLFLPYFYQLQTFYLLSSFFFLTPEVLVVSLDGCNGTVGRIAVFDPCLGRAGVNDATAAQIDRHMAGIADDITGLCIRIGHGPSAGSLTTRGVGQGNTEMLHHLHGKSGTVRPGARVAAAVLVFTLKLYFKALVQFSP